MNSISFDNVYLLFLILPLAVLFTVPYFIVVRKDNLSFQNAASLALHVLMAVIIGFAAAGTSIVTTVTETNVYVVADVSYSASRNLEAIDEYIDRMEDTLPANTRMGVIAFANDYKLVSKMGENLKSVKTAVSGDAASRIDDGGTDIIGALKYAGALFRRSVVKRIVLITDGKQTTGAGASELKAQVDTLNRDGIRVDAIYIDSNLAEGQHEAQLCAADFTQSVYVEEEGPASRQNVANISIRCNSDWNGFESVRAYFKVGYTVNGEEKLEGSAYDGYVELYRGYNVITVPLESGHVGTVEYDVSISFENERGEQINPTFRDFNERNNHLTFTQRVGELGDTLLLAGGEEDVEALRELYGEEVEGWAKPVGKDIPTTVEELCVYDRIILSNVNLDTYVGDTAAFLESLNTVVSSFGKSLITFGDVKVQEDDDGSLQPLADMLPIKYDNTGGRLFTIAVDDSHSMFMADKLSYAKLVAQALLKILNDNDTITLVKFDGAVRPLAVGLRLGDCRNDLVKMINNIETKQSTNIGALMKEVSSLMSSSVYSDKRLYIISDGKTYVGEGSDSINERINQLRRNDVQVSTFGVVPSKASEVTMKNIAELGGGNYYKVTNEESVANLINYDLGREQAPKKGGQGYVLLKRGKDESVKDINASLITSSYVNSYTAGKVRSTATTVLMVENLDGKTADAPLYAYWNYGNGKVMSFAANLVGDIENWKGSKRKDALYKPFFGNVLNGAQPTERIDYPYLFEMNANGSTANVAVTPYELRPDGAVRLTVTDPDGKVSVQDMSYVNSYYTAQFDCAKTGSYTVESVYTVRGKEYRAEKTLSVSYAAEYDSFAVFDEGVLRNAVGNGGTVTYEEAIQIELDEDEIEMYRKSLVTYLLIAAVSLFVIDIAVRKIKKEDIISLFKGVKKHEKGV